MLQFRQAQPEAFRLSAFSGHRNVSAAPTRIANPGVVAILRIERAQDEVLGRKIPNTTSSRTDLEPLSLSSISSGPALTPLRDPAQHAEALRAADLAAVEDELCRYSDYLPSEDAGLGLQQGEILRFWQVGSHPGHTFTIVDNYYRLVNAPFRSCIG
jgi:hypothetical protein